MRPFGVRRNEDKVLCVMSERTSPGGWTEGSEDTAKISFTFSFLMFLSQVGFPCVSLVVGRVAV